jgi:hypothetical protein
MIVEVSVSLKAKIQQQAQALWVPVDESLQYRSEPSASVDNMNASVSGRESLNAAAKPGRDLLETDVFDGTKSVRAQNRSNASRLETADRTFINFLKLFGPLRF